MNFLDLAFSRHSVRAYKSAPVEKPHLDYILECARLAPSAVNRQPWRLVVAESDGAKEAVRAAYNRPWFATAPCYIVVCAVPQEAWTRSADGKNHSDVDASIITEHICLAAADCGLGSCWVCNFLPDMLKRGLKLSGSLDPVAIIPLGYPDEAAVRPLSRKPLSEIVEFK